MKTVANRIPLSSSDRDHFFSIHGHLNYRYTMLWRHKTNEDGQIKMSHGEAICAYESALLVCRVFMEFLGLGVNYLKGVPELVEKQRYFSLDKTTTNEVKVIGTFAKLSSLTSAERDLLCAVYHMAHKSTAHLTFDAPHIGHASVVHKCVPIVDRLLRENLYDVVGEKPHQHSQ